MALQAGTTLRGTRAPAPGRSRLPSGQLRAPGRAYADDPRPTLAERLSAPLDFAADAVDLPCQRDPTRRSWWFAPEEEPGMPRLGETEAAYAQQQCGTCPLELQCRRYALRTGQAWGIWGGVRFAHMHAGTRRALLAETERLLQRRRTA